MRRDKKSIFVVTVIIILCLLIGVVSMARSKIRVEKGKLEDYRARRNFTVTTEPSGNIIKKTEKAPIFVIQKHDARQLHYDLRIEIDGVLKSWAVPKGPSMDPSQKRLAVPTDDHPLEYAHFEGVIPEGQYGAGTVMVWDIGTYENIKRDKGGKLVPMKKCYKEGRIEILLDGEKIKGAFALIRTARTTRGKHNWLLIKMKGEYASARRNPVARQTKSVLTDRTLTQIKKEWAEV